MRVAFPVDGSNLVADANYGYGGTSRGLRAERNADRGSRQKVSQNESGTLLTVRQAWDYTAVIGKERETQSHWQKVRKLILEEADAAVVSWHVRLASCKSPSSVQRMDERRHRQRIRQRCARGHR